MWGFEHATSLQQGNCISHLATNPHISDSVNKPLRVAHTCLDSFTPIWIQPMFGKILLIFSVSVATVIELNMSRFTYMFSSWPQNHLTMLSRDAVRTITMDHRWIHGLTTDCPVLATASFRCCQFAGRLRVFTCRPAVAAVAIAGEVCPEFSHCLSICVHMAKQ